jgi:hypothetical protein
MKNAIPFPTFVILFFAVSCNLVYNLQPKGVPPYIPDSPELHDALVRMDSILFGAYNSCNLDEFASLVSADLEFYNNMGGLMTSKEALLQAIQTNICGKVTRELLKGSIEVYPIPNFGAVQMGAHRFYNYQERETGPSEFSKFVHTWREESGEWKLTRVISLH